MIRQYLISYKQEFMEKRIDTIQSLHKIELKIKENMEFLRLIENSQDKVYDSFSPHNYSVNNTNYIKMKGLKKENESLQKALSDTKTEIEEIEKKIKDLDAMIQYLNHTAKEEMEYKKSQEKKIERKIELENELQEFHLSLLEHEESEKQKIAFVLYDSYMERFSGMLHKLEACHKFAEMDPKRCKLELHSAVKEMKELSKNLKKLSFQIHPVPEKKEEEILKETLIDREMERFQRKNEIEVSYKKEGDFSQVSDIVILTCFRIVKEACKNVKKHANAEHINIYFSCKEDRIQLELADDGCGFDLKILKDNKKDKKAEHGLDMIREKIRLLSGEIKIESKKGKGTKISISVPIE